MNHRPLTLQAATLSALLSVATAASAQPTAASRPAAAASAMARPPVALSPLAMVDSARRAGNNQRIVTTGVRSPEQASHHALVITISGYERNPLPGVLKDRHHATELAARFGVPAAHITQLAEHEATRDGLQRAVAQLQQRVLPGDKVYVFYSGHGARQFDEASGQCVESLFMHDQRLVDHRELMRWLKPVGAKAGKMVVMIDACHSGGVDKGIGSRSIDRLRRTPKFAEQATPARCRQPVNLRSFVQARGVDLDTTELNYVVLAASRDNEVAWDTEEGGAMMSRFMRCVDGQSRDLDGSGTVSMAELARCTQDQLDLALDVGERQHVVVSGNGALVPGFSVKPSPAPEPAPAPTPTPTPAPEPPVVVVNGLAMLEAMHAQRDDRWGVNVDVPRTRLRIGVDALDFRVSSTSDGHVYVFYQGSKPGSLFLLFPNSQDGNNRIRAGIPMTLPRPHWTVKPLGPAGTDHLLVMVTETPRDFSAFALPPEYVSAAGPFTQVALSAAALAAVSQQALFSPALTSAECSSPPKTGLRDLGVARRCSNVFGSAMFSIEETP